MGLFSDKPYTAITAKIEQLCGRRSSDEDAGDLLELIEAIKIAREPGHAEAGRALRKQLKHGSAKQQVRALWLLEMVIDNGGRNMSQLLDDPGLGDQVMAIARGSDKPSKLARSVLSGWSRRDDDRLTRFSRQSHSRQPSAGQSGSHSRHPSGTHPTHTRQPSGSVSGSRRQSPPSRSPSPVNIREGSITSTMATAHTIATRLSEQVITHPNVKQSSEARGYYKQARDMRKRVINLIHQDNAEVHEFLERLLVVNEELITALRAYESAEDRPSSPDLPARPARPARPAPSRTRSPSPDPSPPPSPMRAPRSPVAAQGDDPFADTNEIDDGPLVKPMW